MNRLQQILSSVCSIHFFGPFKKKPSEKIEQKRKRNRKHNVDCLHTSWLRNAFETFSNAFECFQIPRSEIGRRERERTPGDRCQNLKRASLVSTLSIYHPFLHRYSISHLLLVPQHTPPTVLCYVNCFKLQASSLRLFSIPPSSPPAPSLHVLELSGKPFYALFCDYPVSLRNFKI